MKITFSAYQCHVFGTPTYLYFNPYCLHSQSVKLHAWKYSEVLIWPDSAVLLGWNLHCWMVQWSVYWGAILGLQGAKPLFRPIVLAQAVSSLLVEPYDAVHSLKKAS